jgi:hypothetical protein
MMPKKQLERTCDARKRATGKKWKVNLVDQEKEGTYLLQLVAYYLLRPLLFTGEVHRDVLGVNSRLGVTVTVQTKIVDPRDQNCFFPYFESSLWSAKDIKELA